MSKILVNGGMTFVLSETSSAFNNYEFDVPHMLEIGFTLSIPDEVQLILSDFDGNEDKILDNTVPEDDRRFRFLAAHPNCSIVAQVKNGTPAGTYTGGYKYTITAVDD